MASEDCIETVNTRASDFGDSRHSLSSMVHGAGNANAVGCSLMDFGFHFGGNRGTLERKVEIGAVRLDDARKGRLVQNDVQAFADFVSPQKGGVLVHRNHLGGLSHRISLKEAGNELLPDGKVLLGGVEHRPRGKPEAVMTVGAGITLMPVGGFSILSDSLSLCPAYRASQFRGFFGMLGDVIDEVRLFRFTEVREVLDEVFYFWIYHCLVFWG